jgi:hypothetical protein
VAFNHVDFAVCCKRNGSRISDGSGASISYRIIPDPSQPDGILHPPSQRDEINQPSNGVARNELTWVNEPQIPSTLNGLNQSRT